MIGLTRFGAIGLAGIIFAAAGAATGRLPADQLAKAVRTDAISIPTPGELFAAIEKPGKTDWSGQYRGPMPITYRNRAQIALNLGGLLFSEGPKFLHVIGAIVNGALLIVAALSLRREGR